MDLQKIKHILVCHQEFEAAACVRDVQDEILDWCGEVKKRFPGRLYRLRSYIGGYERVEKAHDLRRKR